MTASQASPTALAVALLLAGAAAAPAQDTVRRNDGTVLKGEVLFEDESSVRVLTPLGEVVVVLRHDVKQVRRGPALDARLGEALARVPPDDPDALLALARVARDERRRTADAERIARRALLVVPEHAEAREFLGHVRALGAWHENAKAADAAVRPQMLAEGRTQHEGGWALRADLAALRAAPDEWMLDDVRWRRIVEVMEERGCVTWNGEWYAPEEQDLLPRADLVLERTSLILHPARDGVCIVLSAQGREHARRLAQRLMRCRRWFMKRFAPTRHDYLVKPVSVAYVIPAREQLEGFLYAMQAELHVGGAQIDASLPAGNLFSAGLGHVLALDVRFPDDVVVAGLGLRMLDLAFHPSTALPLPLQAAGAHAALLAESGRTPMDYSKKGVGDEKQTLDDFLNTLRGLRAKGRPIDLREVLEDHGETSYPIALHREALGLALLQYLMDKGDTASTFLNSPEHLDVQARLEQATGMALDAIQKDFEAWLGA